MIWLSGIIGFLIGMGAGAALFRQFKSDTAKVRQLEEKLKASQQEHEDYRQQVHQHFTTTAELFHRLTGSYRDVYKHLAGGARTLCPDDISSQLALASDDRDILTDSSERPEQAAAEEETAPPRDYGVSNGNLSEDYGLKGGKESSA